MSDLSAPVSHVDAVLGQFESEIKNIDTDIAEYDSHAFRYRWLARILRALAIVFFILGTIAPFLHGLGASKICDL